MVRWPHVEGYPGPEQDIYSEGSYGNLPALWSGGRCSVPGKPVSSSQNVHKHHRARWLKIKSFHFLWLLPNMLNPVQSELKKGKKGDQDFPT